MKKALYCLLVLLSIVSCIPEEYSSNYTYFYRDTVSPQEVLDSLLNSELQIDYHTWESYSVLGINNFDSTKVTTYLMLHMLDSVSTLNVTVIEYGNSDTVTIKSKLIYNGTL